MLVNTAFKLRKRSVAVILHRTICLLSLTKLKRILTQSPTEALQWGIELEF